MSRRRGSPARRRGSARTACSRGAGCHQRIAARALFSGSKATNERTNQPKNERSRRFYRREMRMVRGRRFLPRGAEPSQDETGRGPMKACGGGGAPRPVSASDLRRARLSLSLPLRTLRIGGVLGFRAGNGHRATSDGARGHVAPGGASVLDFVRFASLASSLLVFFLSVLDFRLTGRLPIRSRRGVKSDLLVVSVAAMHFHDSFVCFFFLKRQLCLFV